MKKILSSIFTIFALTAIVAGGTQAVFVDTESVTGNTFAAGTIDLKVNGTDDPIAHIDLSNMKPGDGVGGTEHSTISYQYTLSNTGSITGKPWIEVTNLVNKENDCNDPENEVDSTCNNPGIGEGDLGANLHLQINAAGSGGYEYPNAASCIDGRNCSMDYWATHGPIGQNTWENIVGGGSTAPMVLEFLIPTSVGNIIQSDSVEFDVVFHLDQI
jgi:predicted ribosomally synthesized peptide with SipW-like signal peptide